PASGIPPGRGRPRRVLREQQAVGRHLPVAVGADHDGGGDERPERERAEREQHDHAVTSPADSGAAAGAAAASGAASASAAGAAGEAPTRGSGTVKSGSVTPTMGPTSSAKASVPMPTWPPSSQPTVSTVTSMPVRTIQSFQPQRLWMPVMSPSRGPGPSRAPM